MKKDAYYFPHYSNARNDAKIIKLRRVLGLEGYGIYFMLLEALREQTDFTLSIDALEDLAYEWHTSKEKVFSVVNNFDLFTIVGDKFTSQKLILYLQPYIEKSQKARDAANIRWGKVNQIEEKNDLPQVYIILCEYLNEKFIKIGSTTTSVSRRFGGKMPYKYTIIKQLFSNDYQSLELEFHNLVSMYLYKPLLDFSGKAECYNMDCFNDVINYTPDTNVSHMRTHCMSIASKGEESKRNETKPKDNKVKRFDFKKSLSILGIEEQIISDWMIVRKGKKAANTKTSFEAIKKQIELSGKSANECIKTSVENNWSGFKNDWMVNLEFKSQPEQSKNGQHMRGLQELANLKFDDD